MKDTRKNISEMKDTQYIVLREFCGSRSMEDAFREVVEKQVGDGYEKWRTGQSPGGGECDTAVASADIKSDIKSA